jgi:hypothetical protein
LTAVCPTYVAIDVISLHLTDENRQVDTDMENEMIGPLSPPRKS